MASGNHGPHQNPEFTDPFFARARRAWKRSIRTSKQFARGAEPPALRLSFVMGPHPKHFNDALPIQNLVHDAMLDVDAPGIDAGEIADEFFERWRVFDMGSGEEYSE